MKKIFIFRQALWAERGDSFFRVHERQVRVQGSIFKF